MLSHRVIGRTGTRGLLMVFTAACSRGTPERRIGRCKLTVHFGSKFASTPIPVCDHGFAHVAACCDFADLVDGCIQRVCLAKQGKRALRKKHFARHVIAESFDMSQLCAWRNSRWRGAYSGRSREYVDKLMDQCKGLRRGSILIVDDDERRNIVGYRKPSEHALVEIGVMRSEIADEQHEDSKRFDPVSKGSEQHGGCCSRTDLWAIADAERISDRLRRGFYGFSYRQRPNEGEHRDVFVIFKDGTNHVLPRTGIAEKGIEQGLVLGGRSANHPKVLATIARNGRCCAIESRQGAPVRRCNLQ